jgi:hypothetical protein
MNFKTKPRGDQLSFLTECVRCRGELSISNGRVTPHDCRDNKPVTLEQIRFALGK